MNKYIYEITKRAGGDIPSPAKKENPLKRFWDTFNWAIISLLIFFIMFRFVLFVGIVPSQSMESTVWRGSFMIGNRIGSHYDRGDVVVFFSHEKNEYMIKRVIGVAGDSIVIKDGKVFLNGNELQESYSQGVTEAPDGKGEYLVPDNCLFLLGDNREESLDARYWENSYISCDDVKCTVFASAAIGSDHGTYIHGVK